MKMGWEIAAVASVFINIFLLSELLYYKHEACRWKRLSKAWRDAAEYWQESYNVMSDGFKALWRMHKRENHERNQVDNPSV